ncbi:hypothetical protein DPC53_14225 [Escherichia coli]|nr:hypothetical protein DPC53_14225 [Escherichia coli]
MCTDSRRRRKRLIRPRTTPTVGGGVLSAAGFFRQKGNASSAISVRPHFPPKRGPPAKKKARVQRIDNVL